MKFYLFESEDRTYTDTKERGFTDADGFDLSADDEGFIEDFINDLVYEYGINVREEPFPTADVNNVLYNEEGFSPKDGKRIMKQIKAYVKRYAFTLQDAVLFECAYRADMHQHLVWDDRIPAGFRGDKHDYFECAIDPNGNIELYGKDPESFARDLEVAEYYNLRVIGPKLRLTTAKLAAHRGMGDEDDSGVASQKYVLTIVIPTEYQDTPAEKYLHMIGKQ